MTYEDFKKKQQARARQRTQLKGAPQRARCCLSHFSTGARVLTRP